MKYDSIPFKKNMSKIIIKPNLKGNVFKVYYILSNCKNRSITERTQNMTDKNNLQETKSSPQNNITDYQGYFVFLFFFLNYTYLRFLFYRNIKFLKAPVLSTE